MDWIWLSDALSETARRRIIPVLNTKKMLKIKFFRWFYLKKCPRIIGKLILVFLSCFFGVPHLATCIFLSFLLIEPELGAGIDPGMALTPFPSRNG